MAKKRKRYVIDETNTLPDLLETRKIYLCTITKEIHEFNEYEKLHYLFLKAIENGIKFPIHDILKEITNKKAAKLLFNSNRQELTKKK